MSILIVLTYGMIKQIHLEHILMGKQYADEALEKCAMSENVMVMRCLRIFGQCTPRRFSR